jgi:hypothetical protein
MFNINVTSVVTTIKCFNHYMVITHSWIKYFHYSSIIK